MRRLCSCYRAACCRRGISGSRGEGTAVLGMPRARRVPARQEPRRAQRHQGLSQLRLAVGVQCAPRLLGRLGSTAGCQGWNRQWQWHLWKGGSAPAPWRCRRSSPCRCHGRGGWPRGRSPPRLTRVRPQLARPALWPRRQVWLCWWACSAWKTRRLPNTSSSCKSRPRRPLRGSSVTPRSSVTPDARVPGVFLCASRL